MNAYKWFLFIRLRYTCWQFYQINCGYLWNYKFSESRGIKSFNNENTGFLWYGSKLFTKMYDNLKIWYERYYIWLKTKRFQSS